MNPEVEILIEAAKSGGQVIKKYFGKNLKVREKSIASDFLTQADLDSEKAILKILSKEFPEYNIFSEERGSVDKKSEYTFIVDPLDGSNNFILGIPNFSVCIALLKKNEIISSVVYNPILDKVYCAEKGKGAFLNGKKLKVNKEKDIKKASIAYNTSYIHSKSQRLKLIEGTIEKGIKRYFENWSPAIDFCLLASGKIEAVVSNANEVYDFIPGKLIAKEAGALITDFEGRKEKSDKNNIFLASNGTTIHQEILEILRSE